MSEFDKDKNLNEDVTESTQVPEDINTPEPSTAQKVVKETISWVFCIAIAVVIALFLRTYVFTMVKVDGDSMYPTLKNGERLFTRIIAYTPERGDIIIFHPKHNPSTSYVKRVIATEGDRIWIDETNGNVHLLKKGSSDWEILDEPYINETTVSGGIAQKITDDSGEYGLLIEKDHVFVMGDNRNNSRDSRDGIGVGQVHVDSITGKASFRWWPLSEFGGLN